MVVAPRKLAPGDRVAVLSPSFAAPALFPARHEQAMRWLRDSLGVVPVEFPTTRLLNAPAEARAAGLTAAYADPAIRAVFATIGGDDQITVLPHLDPAVFRADPKPFLGFSDNTNLLNWLWLHGIAAFHGGSTQVHLARPQVRDIHERSLRAALFDGGDLEITPVSAFTDEEIDWADPRSLTETAPDYPSAGWHWHRPDRVVTAPTWGGNLEVLTWNLAANRWMTDKPRPIPDRDRHRADQRDAVLAALNTYHPEAMAVFGVDFGHTDPQWILPYGGRLTVDGPARRITAHYG